MRTIFYRTEGRGPYGIAISDSQDITRPREQQEIIESCAGDFFHNRDGFAAKWPRMFTLHETKDGPAVALMQVEFESEPVFSAYQTTTKDTP